MNEKNNEMMTSRIEQNKIIIEIPIELLIFAQKYRLGYSYKITDKNNMSKHVTDNILTFNEDQEDGTTAFQKMLDELFDDAYENAEDWIEMTDGCEDN